MNLLLSVIITTYNRAVYLERCIDGMENQSLCKLYYEVIVIDNASSDNTRELVETKMLHLKNLKYVFEAKPGLNEARNTGLREAKGNYIAYLDDDAVPNSKWAEKIVAAFTRITPQPGVVGGPTLPVWEGSKPDWLIPKFEGAISMVNYGSEKRFLQGKEFLVGANMAFLKTALDRVGGFIPGLDRVKNKLISGGDTAAIEKVKRLGYGVYYDPAIAVDHYVSSARLNHKWFISRYYWGGYSEALMWQMLEKPSFKLLLKRMGYYIYGFFRNPSHILYLMHNTYHPEQFWFKCIAHARVGYLIGLFKLLK